MKQLSDAIEKFSLAADRLDEAVLRAARRAEARADGAAAQGDVILRLRGEIDALKQALEGPGGGALRPEPMNPNNDRSEPSLASG